MSTSAKSRPQLELLKGGPALRRSALESSNCHFVVFGGDVALPWLVSGTARLVLCGANVRPKSGDEVDAEAGLTPSHA